MSESAVVWKSLVPSATPLIENCMLKQPKLGSYHCDSVEAQYHESW